jgi:hypothetical protein
LGLKWNGDFETGDLSQWAGVEYGGTFDGTPPLSEQVKILTEDAGLKPLFGKYMAKILVPPGSQYGGSTGWRCLMRPHPDAEMLVGNGYDSTWVYTIAVPSDFPQNGSQALWVAGLEIHHSNGVNGAPHHMQADTNKRFWVDVAGGDLNNRTVSVKQAFRAFTNVKWYVVVERYKHDAASGAYELYIGEVGTDQAPVLQVSKNNIPTQYFPYNGQEVKNYPLFGLYVDQVGTATTAIYLDQVREYDTLAESLEYAKQLLTGTAVPPTPPEVTAQSNITEGMAIIGPFDWEVTVTGPATDVEFWVDGKSLGKKPIISGVATYHLDPSKQPVIANGGYWVWNNTIIAIQSPSIHFSAVAAPVEEITFTEAEMRALTQSEIRYWDNRRRARVSWDLINASPVQQFRIIHGWL